MIGCHCAVCQSSEPHNKRLRPSILVTNTDLPAGHGNVLVDTTPEMRLQVLRAGIERIESVLVTHNHADHIFGMDDIRQFNFLHSMSMPIYSDTATLDHLRMVFGYAFRETQAGGGKPQLDLTTVAPFETFETTGISVTPLPIYHGNMPILSYKFGSRFAYVTDVSRIPDETMPYLKDLDTLVIGTVRREPHPTHFGLQQALDVIADLAPRRAFLTHLSHHFDHNEINAELPAHIRMAYDGLQLSIPAAGGH
jgi:phosphoribosyl 1,2-cyclic phosphate phosphodiesterase